MMHMRNIKNNLIKTGIYISLIAFGYILARFINFPHFEFSKTIDISDILGLVVTIWLAILITTVLEKQKNDHRVEKDLIISRVGSIYEIASSLQIGSNSGQIHLTEASSSLKRINTSLNSIHKIIEKCHFNVSNEIKCKTDTCLSELRDVLTSTPSIPVDQINSNDIPIAVREGIIHYNRERVSQIEVKFETLKDLLLELQIEINKK